MKKSKINYEMFFKHEDVKFLWERAETVSVWDFNCAPGNTFEERCRSIAFSITGVTGMICRKGCNGYFSVVVGPELALILEYAGLIDRTDVEREDHIATEFQEGLSYFGLMQNRWAVYCDTHMETNRMLVGTSLNAKQPKTVGRISLANFVI